MKIVGTPVNISTKKGLSKKTGKAYQLTEFTLLSGTDVYVCVSFQDGFDVLPDLEQEFEIKEITGKKGIFQVVI